MASWGANLWQGRSGEGEFAIIREGKYPVGVTRGEEESAEASSGEGGRERWEERGAAEALRWAEQNVTALEDAFNATLLDAARRLHPTKGRTISRRTLNGWYPALSRDRRGVKRVDRALARVREGRLDLAITVARRRGAPSELKAIFVADRGLSLEDGRIMKELGDLRTALRYRMQGKARAAERQLLSDRVAKREALFAKGGFRDTVNGVLGGRKSAKLLRYVTDSGGTEHATGLEVMRAVNEHFEVAFGGEQGQVEAGRFEPLRRLASDSYEGRELREAAVRGELPAEWREALGDENFTRLSEMFARKVVRRPGEAQAQPLEDGWHGDWLAPITDDEWSDFWKHKSRTSSPGDSGVGPDLWREAPVWLHAFACRLYSAVLRLKVQPDSWRRDVLVPIPKKEGENRLDQLRPLKLLEVSKKAVQGIVKGRMREELEREGVLDGQQHGFRTGLSTATAAIPIVASFKQAMRERADIHAVFLDIAKAYDSVERGLGKGAALRRLGVGADVTEWLMETDRRCKTRVRTGWEPRLVDSGVELEWFVARRGFPQGASESPLLWIMFYDAVISQALREGVGASANLSKGSITGRGMGLGCSRTTHRSWRPAQKKCKDLWTG